MRYCRGLKFHLELAEWGIEAWGPLASLQSLTRLDLRGCNLVRLPTELEQLSQLQHLDLGGNHLRGHPQDEGDGSSSSAYAPLLRLPALSHLGVCHCMLDDIPVQLLHVAVLDRGIDGSEPPPAAAGVEEQQD